MQLTKRWRHSTYSEDAGIDYIYLLSDKFLKFQLSKEFKFSFFSNCM